MPDIEFDGDLFRAARTGAGRTQQQLSQQTGYAQPTIAQIECGRIHPSVAALCEFAAALDVPISTFFRDGRVSFVDYEATRHVPSELGTDADTWIANVVEHAPELTTEQAQRVSAVLFTEPRN